MRFYDREEEIRSLTNISTDSRIAVVGRRRIGKTTLVERFYGDKAITLFVPAEKMEKAIIADWCREYQDLPPVDDFRTFFEHVFRTQKDRCIFIDEIQNITKVSPSFLFDLQHLIDRFKPNLVVSGSLIRTMKGVVEDYKSPLYGRFDLILKLRELDLRTISLICKDLGLAFEDAIRLYMIFGGIPKYYELIEKIKKFDLNEFVLDSFIRYPRPLFEEVRTQLREEFGSEFKTYFTILYAISQGCTRQNEIAGFLGRKDTSLTKYLSILRDDLELVSRSTPIAGGRNGTYSIRNNLFSFWFSNVWKNVQYLETGQEKMAQYLLTTQMEHYLSRRFENVCREAVPLIAPFEPLMVGSQWGRIPGAPKAENQYEIDVVAFDPRTGDILYGECKWKDRVDAVKVLSELERKVQHVPLTGKAHYAIFARSFSRKAKGALNIGLDDLERLVSQDRADPAQ